MIGTLNVGLVKHLNYPEPLLNGLGAAGQTFLVTWHDDQDKGQEALRQKHIDGLLLPRKESPGIDVMVFRKASIRGAALVESLMTLQRSVEDRPPWVSNILTLDQGGLEEESLPTWILMMLLMVGFVVMPTQVAEEKEKRLLLGLLQTPISENTWLIAKIVTGMILGLGSVAMLHVLSQVSCSHWFSYIAFLCVGSFYFSGLGILLGLLCRTQAAARALGLVFYLPHLLPSALGDFSQKMNAVAQIVPSYQFYVPIKSILQQGGSLALFSSQIVYLSLAGAAFSLLASHLLKKRWLMPS